MQSGGSVLIFLFFQYFIFPQLANADLEDIHDRRERAVMEASTEDEGYKRECEKTTNTKEEYINCAKKFSELIAQQNRERAEKKAQGVPDPAVCERDMVINKCEQSFVAAQKKFTDANIQQCRSDCMALWFDKKISGCGALTKKKIEEKLAYNFSFCAIASSASAGELTTDEMCESNLGETFKQNRDIVASGPTNFHIETQTPVVTSMNSESTECIKSNIDDGLPPLCAHYSTAVGGYKSAEYYYQDRKGNKFNSKEAAVQSNNSILGPFQPGWMQTSSMTPNNHPSNVLFGGAIIDRGAIAEVDVTKDTRPGSGGGGSLKPAGASPTAGGASGGGGASMNDNHSSDPLVTDTNNQTPPDNQNTQTASVPPSSNGGTGSSSLGGGSSAYGDASMFPSLQSAKSFKSSDEATGGSSLSSFRGSNSSSSGGGYKSYSGGATGFKSTNTVSGKSSEVAGGGRVYAPSGSISRGGVSGTGVSGGLGSQGVAVASVSPNNENSQRVLRIGDQGFYKPGGSAAGAGTGASGGKYASGKNKRRKKLKSLGGCAPGDLQCVLSSLGRSANGTRVGSRRGLDSGSRLPAGVTSGVEDIFSRIVKFHNHNISLDHEGMIDNTSNGVSD
jgi:hypothetical protein